MNCPYLFEYQQAGASSEDAGFCVSKGRPKPHPKFTEAWYLSRSIWFQTQPNDACVVCEQCVTRGLNFSDLVMATQFILTWFSGGLFPSFWFVYFLTKFIYFASSQQVQSLRFYNICIYFEISIKLQYTYGLPIFYFLSILFCSLQLSQSFAKWTDIWGKQVRKKVELSLTALI